tara:strand:- start:265 stop:570 length:306 start_codon:yes stop_codon:yes gene_type:complete
MSRSYPIWNNITACCYQSGKSYGVKETGENNICVGSSLSNSHDFLKTIITKRLRFYKDELCVVFSYSVDDVILKKMIFENNNGKAGDHIKTITKLNKIKSL